MRLFEVLGGWVATVPELDVKMRLGTHCYHHAWHSELWHKRLPELREMNPDRLTLPANDELVAFVDAMTEPEAPGAHDREARRGLPGADPAQDRGVHVPPEQHQHHHRRSHHPVAAASPWPDEFEDWRDGEMLIQSLIDSPDDVERAAAHQVRLETLMLAAGGIAGPGSIGGEGASAGAAEVAGVKRMLPPTSWLGTSASCAPSSPGHDPRPLPGDRGRAPLTPATQGRPNGPGC